jgi:hypothetical protein
MFERFPLSVGVANLMRFAAELHTWPAYLTRANAAPALPRWRALLRRARPDAMCGRGR